MVLALSMALGTGLMVNGVLKEHWGRSRPNTAQAFGGTLAFAPALQPSRQCATNCSFVSGHSATGFTVMAVGLLGAPATRRRWLLYGAGCGLLIGLVRMAQGGHYLSDVLFSGMVVWLCNLCLAEIWIRVKARRLHRRSLEMPMSTERNKP
jgi:lipid A 4'-phosphatase